MKKTLMFVLIIIASFAFSVSVFASAKFDKTNANNGYISITYDGSLDKKIKIKVELAGVDGCDYYDLTSNKATNIPLARGDGSYKISVLKNIKDTSYASIASETLSAKISDPNARFLVSNAYVNFEKDMDFLKGYNTTLEKVDAINEKLAKFYDDVVHSVVYDTDKMDKIVAKQITSYVPVIDTTYKTKKGICSDYSTLVAGYLRSLGIPTKVVTGRNPEVGAELHAWNEIYVDGKWLVVDATWDAAYVQAGEKYTMSKDWKNLTVSKQY